MDGVVAAVAGADRPRAAVGVRAAVGERLPATQEDVREMRTELRRIARRLEAIEKRLGDTPAKPRTAKTAAKRKTAAKPKRGTGSGPGSGSSS